MQLCSDIQPTVRKLPLLKGPRIERIFSALFSLRAKRRNHQEKIQTRLYSYSLRVPAVNCTLETGAGCQLRTKGHLETGLRWLAAGGLAAPLSPGHVSRPGPALASSLPRMRNTSPDPEREYRVTLAEYFSLESPP